MPLYLTLGRGLDPVTFRGLVQWQYLKFDSHLMWPRSGWS